MTENDIIRRLERLERANLHWKVTCALLVGAGSLALGGGYTFAKQESSNEVANLRVRSLELVDTAGKVQAKLQIKPGAGPQLSFNRANGKPATFLGITSSGGGFLAFNDTADKNALVAGYFPNGKETITTVQLFKNEDIRNQLIVDNSGDGWITMRDRKGKERILEP